MKNIILTVLCAALFGTFADAHESDAGNTETMSAETKADQKKKSKIYTL